MADRSRNASLAAQMERLHQSIQSREDRRKRDLEQKLASTEGDAYSDRPSKKAANATGGVSLGPAAAALAAVASASALGGPAIQRCQVCQANFGSEAELQQHLAGPSHKKALERAAAAQRRLNNLGKHAGAADSALGAAQWQEKQGAAGWQAPASTSGGGSGTAWVGAAPGIAGRPPPPRPTPAGAAAKPAQADLKPWQQGRKQKLIPAVPAGKSHAELVAAARQSSNEPLSIDGWVPPTIPSGTAFNATAAPAEPSRSSDSESSDGSGVSPASEAGAADDAQAEAADAAAQPGAVQEEGLGGLVAYGDDSSSSSNSDSEGHEQGEPKIVSFF